MPEKKINLIPVWSGVVVALVAALGSFFTLRADVRHLLSIHGVDQKEKHIQELKVAADQIKKDLQKLGPRVGNGFASLGSNVVWGHIGWENELPVALAGSDDYRMSITGKGAVEFFVEDEQDRGFVKPLVMAISEHSEHNLSVHFRAGSQATFELATIDLSGADDGQGGYEPFHFIAFQRPSSSE